MLRLSVIGYDFLILHFYQLRLVKLIVISIADIYGHFMNKPT